MPQRFTATENAFNKGIENTKGPQGIKLIEAWEGEIENADFPGKKGLAGDLERLKKALEKDDGEGVYKLLEKLGAETLKAADRAEDEKVAEKVRSLGEALSNARGGGDKDAGGKNDRKADDKKSDDKKDDAKAKRDDDKGGAKKDGDKGGAKKDANNRPRDEDGQFKSEGKDDNKGKDDKRKDDDKSKDRAKDKKD